MLDDLERIAQLDGSDALGLAAETPAQLLKDFMVGELTADQPISSVVYSGMGGSALQADLVQTFPALTVPFVVVKDYNLPDFVGPNTLVIVASYSGNTEEMLEGLEQARQAGAQIVVLAGGGKLQAEAESHGHRYFQVPKAVQPRMAVFYAYRLLVEVLVGYGLAPKSAISQLEQAAAGLQTAVQSWLPTVPTEDNYAKQLALQLTDKTPIVYAGQKMAPAAYKWKISFNESSKNTAWMGILPEFDHNEFMGWTSHPADKPFAVIDLVSTHEHPRTQKRFEIGDQLLTGMRPNAITVEAVGESAVEHLLYLVLLGDFVSLYLGILNGVDPSPVSLIEELKKQLG